MIISVAILAWLEHCQEKRPLGQSLFYFFEFRKAHFHMMTCAAGLIITQMHKRQHCVDLPQGLVYLVQKISLFTLQIFLVWLEYCDSKVMCSIKWQQGNGYCYLHVFQSDEVRLSSLFKAKKKKKSIVY